MSSLTILHRFHDRHAGASDAVFGGADVGDGRSSYDHLADRVADGPILDLACGDGPLLAKLADRGVQGLVGFDANGSELAAAGRRLAGRDVRLVQGLAQELPFEDGAFAAVTSHMALMLMDDPARVLAEVRRVLRPGGKLAFVVGRSAPDLPSEIPVWKWLSARWREEGLSMTLGDPRWRDASGISGLLATRFEGLALTELDAWQHVPVAEMGAFLERAYYPVDVLSDGGKEALAAFLVEQGRVYAPEGRWPWRFEMTLGECRRA